eukprot:5370373-Amphidinium_carterae.2
MKRQTPTEGTTEAGVSQLLKVRFVSASTPPVAQSLAPTSVSTWARCVLAFQLPQEACGSAAKKGECKGREDLPVTGAGHDSSRGDVCAMSHRLGCEGCVGFSVDLARAVRLKLAFTEFSRVVLGDVKAAVRAMGLLVAVDVWVRL